MRYVLLCLSVLLCFSCSDDTQTVKPAAVEASAPKVEAGVKPAIDAGQLEAKAPVQLEASVKPSEAGPVLVDAKLSKEVK